MTASRFARSIQIAAGLSAGVIFIVLVVIIARTAATQLTRLQKGVNDAYLNDLAPCKHDGMQKCQIKANGDLTALPANATTDEYDVQVATYLAHLINRAYNGKFTAPEGITVHAHLTDGSVEYALGYLLTDRHDRAYVVFRGTVTTQEWETNLDYETVSLRSVPNLHSFADAFSRVHLGWATTANSVIEDLKPHRRLLSRCRYVYLSGHSLGGPIATLCALWVRSMSIKCTVYTFAAPRFGNIALSAQIDNDDDLSLFRIVNSCDVVPALPPAVVPNFTGSELPDLYMHAGRLANFEANWGSVTNNHLLPIYIAAMASGLTSTTVAVAKYE